MNIRRYLVAAACAATMAAPAGAQARPQTLQMLVPVTTTHALHDVADLFVGLVDERFDGRYRIDLVGPDVIPSFEQFDPVSAGLFPMALAIGAYHSGSTGIGLAADAVDGDPDKRREAGIWDAYQDYYLNHDVRMISFPSASPGYQFLLAAPVGEDGGFQGRIIRGTLTYHGPINAFGGSPSVMPVSETYTSAERGIINGAGHNIFGAHQLGLHEVLPYLVRPGFGTSSLMVLVNEGAWEGIPEADQEVFLEIGRELEHVTIAHYAKLIADETVLMEKAGAQLTELGAAQAAQLDQVFADGVWGEAIRLSGQHAERIRVLAQDAGMTH